jgi:4,5-dihydroxyphthalate decarboxylase
MAILKTCIQNFGHTEALKTGKIDTGPWSLEFEEVPAIIQAFRRMVRGTEFDVSEMAITTYLCAREHGKPFTALPVFIVRAFHHGAILVNRNLGIEHPRQLEGRKVGVNRGYTVTAGVWARAVLQHQYGVDLSKITWVLSGDEHVAEYKAPGNVVPVEAGQKIEDLLISGEVAAAVGLKVDNPNLVPLIADAQNVAFSAMRESGYYPINHTVVVRNELLEQYPDLAPTLFKAFADSKRQWLERLQKTQASERQDGDRFYGRVMDTLGGDPLPFGIAPNRRALETVIRSASEQGILTRQYALDEIFAAGTLDLAG